MVDEKYVVVKYGGNAFGKSDTAVFKDINQMKEQGVNIALVHGGGPNITEGLKRIGIESEFKCGLRVTKDQYVATEIANILTGVGKRIAAQIKNGIGLCGTDARLMEARKKKIIDVDLGYVGEIKEVNVDAIKTLCKAGFIPVIAPVAQDMAGDYYNINADDVALAIAVWLKAEKLIYLTNVDGVLKDMNNPESLITELNSATASELIKEGVISGGMIPKIRSCVDCVKNGVKEVHIANGSLEQSILASIIKGENGIKSTKIFDLV